MSFDEMSAGLFFPCQEEYFAMSEYQRASESFNCFSVTSVLDVLWNIPEPRPSLYQLASFEFDTTTILRVS